MKSNHSLTVALALGAFLMCGAAGCQEEVMESDFSVSSPAFKSGESIPARFTTDGQDLSPALLLDGVPAAAVSFALIVDDPDAPAGTWIHWVVWNIPADITTIPEGGLPDAALSGRNSWGRTGYNGPAPPSGTHRYFFKLFALDRVLQLGPHSDQRALLDAMEGHVLARAQLMGTYSR
jgi:Raf kinase inhibitor-like YbhB/YbcL family protein